MRERIWVVGGSSGIGFELVRLLLKQEYRVVVSSRNATHSKALLALKKEYDDKLYCLDLDVTDVVSMDEKVKEAWRVYQGIDIWFYNAGAYEAMSVSEWKLEQFELMNQVNYLGVVRLMHALEPLFHVQGSGRWIWNLSLSSYFGLPLGGAYSAPKAALVNLAEALQPELKQRGTTLQIINHGFVKTRLTAKNSFEMPELMEPKEAAEKILEGMNSTYHFEIRFPFKLGLFLRALRCMPYKLSLALTRKMLP
jgi:NAD(P)-dependent dehydrogenase (short-subunit alcohol dehydrogenase family)